MPGSKSMENETIADLFEEMAGIYELQEVEWKPQAYRKAARTLRSMGTSVKKVDEKGGLKALKALPGIGESMAEKIEEFLKTGKIKEHDTLVKKAPKGIEELLHVPGLGPKRVKQLVKELGIKSLGDLKKAAKKGEIRELEGFGKKSEEDILRGLGLVEQSKKRSLLGVALPLARELKAAIEKSKTAKRVVVAGSLRRMKETIGDVDILVSSTKPKDVMKTVLGLSSIKNVLAKGTTKTSVILKEGMQVDVRVVKPKSFGAALQYFTGNKDHNVALRQLAIKKGYKLSEYGLFKKDKYVCGKTEDAIYKKVGLGYIPPEMRTNTGEIEAAKKKLPNLVELKDIKGDLQMHSTWSDGANSIMEMARAAEERGYKYIAITDHSKSERIAGGMDEKKLAKYLKEIEKVQKKVSIHIFKGAEVDILKDGSLDYADKTLKQLDVVVAAVHSGFKQSKNAMMKRITTALENPHVNILAHPTGRVLHKREGYAVDIAKLAEVAKENDVALEIDAHRERLDLNGANAREVVAKGCKVAIDTDSHAASELDFMELGVGQAWRGWVEKKDVINTWSKSKVEKFLKR